MSFGNKKSIIKKTILGGLAALTLLGALLACGGGGESQKPPPATRTQPPVPRAGAAFLPGGKPYLQLGPGPQPGTLELLWMAPGDQDQAWQVATRVDGAWQPQPAPTHVLVNLGMPSEPEHRVYRQALQGLTPGQAFSYRVQIGTEVVFESEAKALPGPGGMHRVAVVGDLVSGDLAPARRMAGMLLAKHPDLVVVPGDMVNLEGHANQYRGSLFSTWNADPGVPASGAPLMRSIPVAGCLGNNDTDRVGERRGPRSPMPNGLAYYYYFSMPLNGPVLRPNQGPTDDRTALTPWLNPAAHDYAPFLRAAAGRYRKMGNYSFDSGDIHWVVLDSSLYMDFWQDAAAQAWLRQDLAASTQPWKFAVFHHPVFSHHGGTRHYWEKYMRRIWPILEAGGVSMTFSGHLHAYQRAQPLRVRAFTGTGDGSHRHFGNDANLVEDRAFTGSDAHTRAHGIIPIITGAGGAHYHNYTAPAPGRPTAMGLQPTRFIQQRLSYSYLEVNANKVEFRQIGEDPATGQPVELDHFTLTR